MGQRSRPSLYFQQEQVGLCFGFPLSLKKERFGCTQQQLSQPKSESTTLMVECVRPTLIFIHVCMLHEGIRNIYIYFEVHIYVHNAYIYICIRSGARFISTGPQGGEGRPGRGRASAIAVLLHESSRHWTRRDRGGGSVGLFEYTYIYNI